MVKTCTCIFWEMHIYSSQHLKWIKKIDHHQSGPKTRTHFCFRTTLMKGFDPLQMLTSIYMCMFWRQNNFLGKIMWTNRKKVHFKNCYKNYIYELHLYIYYIILLYLYKTGAKRICYIYMGPGILLFLYNMPFHSKLKIKNASKMWICFMLT